MITTNDRIRVLKNKMDDPAVPLENKLDILEFFKEFNDIFYGDINIDSFFRQLKALSSKWEHRK